jgi:4-diphosphocytidyl-2-C-methyl-D-erythritol kinase
MPSLTLSAPAKINLSLRILGKREDGFHALETRMVRIGVADEVLIETLEEGQATHLTCSEPSLPCDESNLALRALRAFEQETGIAKAWHIHLEKHVPAGAGLGGGSSDAAAVLRGLNDLCDQPLNLQRLAELGAALGSDVPFFLYDAVCDATGRGEVVTPVEWPHKLTLVLVKPPFGVSTPWAYKQWQSSQPIDGVRYSPQLCDWGSMVNDLERPVFQKHLLLPTLKTWFLEQPETAAALMSGSGSTMFAVVKAGADAAALAARAQELAGAESWVRVTHTL